MRAEGLLEMRSKVSTTSTLASISMAVAMQEGRVLSATLALLKMKTAQ